MVLRFFPALVAGWLFCSPLPAASASAGPLRDIGVAKVDITPAYPVRLSGYAARKSESEGVAQHIYAKALAIGSDKEQPALLLTVENCGVPSAIRSNLIQRLTQKHPHLRPERVAVCSTHTHSAPWLFGYLSNLVVGPLPGPEQQRMQRYTRELEDALEQVAVKALANRKPAHLSRGLTSAGFAANRRTKGGPVDHDLPVLAVTGPEGELQAIVTSYACHCTTLTGEFNQICGDWAGYAQEYLERDHPGATVLVAIGCGGDSNPDPRPGFEHAKAHGQSIATAVNQLLVSPLAPVRGLLACAAREIQLPFDALPTRAEWEEKAKDKAHLGQHARTHLARLDRGEAIRTQLPYYVQTWSFGRDLAMVFLEGEVVVDYSLRLKTEFDSSKLWINAYANGVPCYIPSERVLKEGGYEGAYAMIYYDQPTRFAAGIENLIVQAVTDLLPKDFRARRTAALDAADPTEIVAASGEFK